jgi:hypothetical protein
MRFAETLVTPQRAQCRELAQSVMARRRIPNKNSLTRCYFG